MSKMLIGDEELSMRIYQVDAFAQKMFAGNPAAVCLMTEEVSDDWMQAMAQEMNLSETAFVRREGDGFRLRWFTPATEVDLCGHATLATAHTLWDVGWLAEGEQARFMTRSGVLTAEQAEGMIWLNFPEVNAERRRLQWGCWPRWDWG